MSYNELPNIDEGTYTRALRSAIAATPGTCAAAYLENGEVKILGNHSAEDAAYLFERAAAQLRGVDESLG